MKYYTAPEGVWLLVDEESILVTTDSGTGLKVEAADNEDRWGKLYPVNGR